MTPAPPKPSRPSPKGGKPDRGRAGPNAYGKPRNVPAPTGKASPHMKQVHVPGGSQAPPIAH